MNMESKRLYRSEANHVLAGVCGGVGEYLGVDPVVVRLAWVLLTVFTGFVPGLLAYLIAMAIMPHKPHANVQ
jgi:phage shock protein PspC (stress-responsive transcriptional regulator)